jgi:hypothetical protein
MNIWPEGHEKTWSGVAHRMRRGGARLSLVFLTCIKQQNWSLVLLVLFPCSIPVLFPAPSLFAPSYDLAPSEGKPGALNPPLSMPRLGGLR